MKKVWTYFAIGCVVAIIGMFFSDICGDFFNGMDYGSKMYPKGCSLAFEALMKETPYNHYDSGCDGICPECRSCRFHRPYWNISPAFLRNALKEASNRKQEIDRQHYTIPNQRPKDKHCGKI